jgi:hypothetical protein
MSVLGFNSALEKQPSEILSIRTEWADVADSLVQTGYEMNAVDLVVFGEDGSNKTTSMLSGSATVDANNNYIFATIINGNDGSNYYARFKTTWIKATQPNQVIERDLKIEVRQKGF